MKNRGNGLKNPSVRIGAQLRVEDVMGSKMMAYPITSQEIKPLCDGACTVILAKEEKAKKLTNKPVWITGGLFTTLRAFFRVLAPAQGVRILLALNSSLLWRNQI